MNVGPRSCTALLLGAALLGCVFAVPPKSASRVTYYVSPAGSDANAGTTSAPFRTIQKAATLVNPGDVVVVGDGIYTDHDADGAVLRIRRGGTSIAPVTFRAATRWMAKLDGQNGVTANGIDFDNRVGHVRIEGFEIFGFANVGDSATGRGSSSGVDLYDGGHDVQIVGNHIHDIGRVCTRSTNTNGQVGIFVQQANVTIEGNLIHDIGRFFPGDSGCTYARGFGGYETLDHGVYLNGGTNGADGAVVRNNIFHTMRHGWAIQLYNGSLADVRIVSNTFAFGNARRSFTHIVLDAEISNGVIANNIFYDPEGGRTIDASDFSGTIAVASNLTSGSTMTTALFTPRGMTLVENRTSTDPLFVNAPRDFHLRTGSPAIDKARPQPDVAVDFDGTPRPRGIRADIGAYER
jgi:hypothetical protein